jgi:hypothetical protein
MRHSRLVALVVAVASFSVVGVASAQTKQPQEDSYTYTFIDDDLLADTLSSPPPILKGGWRNRRITLIRPRASFVAEMLTTVEAM